MSGTSCPKCGVEVAATDVFCPSCDYVIDVAQVLGEDEGTDEIDFLSVDSGASDEGELFDPDAEEAEPRTAPARLDAELAAELALVLDDGTGTVELLDDGADDDHEHADVAGDPLGPAALFDDPDASMEGDPVLPPTFADGGSYGGEALILGDVGDANGDGRGFESMLSDATGAIILPGCALEPSPIYVATSVQQLTAPTAVLALKEGAASDALALSPFERHVLGFVDGRRTVLRIARKAGLSMSDTVVALGLLADRGLFVLKGHARLRGAPAPAAPAASSSRALDPFGDDLALDDPLGQADQPLEPMELSLEPDEPSPAPAELPLDALTPLELPADALTPLSSISSPPSAPPSFVAVDDDEELAVRSAASFGGVRPAAALRPATVATAPRAGLVVREPPPVSAPSASPSSSSSPSASATSAGPRRPAAAVVTPAKVAVDPAAQARAMQLIEVAQKELREGRKVTALAWVKMAQQLVPDDPKIASLLQSWGESPAKLAASAEQPASPKTTDGNFAAEARSLEAAGDAQGAANAYRRAIKLKPDDPELYNRLGILLALRLKDCIGATAALKKALEYAPTNLAYRSNLGKVVKMAAGQKLADEALYTGDEAHKVKPGEQEQKSSSFLERLKSLRKR